MAEYLIETPPLSGKVVKLPLEMRVNVDVNVILDPQLLNTSISPPSSICEFESTIPKGAVPVRLSRQNWLTCPPSRIVLLAVILQTARGIANRTSRYRLASVWCKTAIWPVGIIVVAVETPTVGMMSAGNRLLGTKGTGWVALLFRYHVYPTVRASE